MLVVVFIQKSKNETAKTILWKLFKFYIPNQPLLDLAEFKASGFK